MAKPADEVFKADGAVPGDTPSSTETLDIESETQRSDFPCSVAQERFWLLDRLDPGNSAYNVAVRWRLAGTVSTKLLEQAWLKIIERHEILRTIFLEVEGVPVQRVLPHAPFRLQEVDLSDLDPAAQQVEGDRIGIIDARASFDLSSGPMLRATLLRFSPTDSIILVTTHQIVSDGWSIGVMAREMGEFYRALHDGRNAVLEPLSVQYADYSLWQLEWLQARGIDAEVTYWSRQLDGVKPFAVRADRPRPRMPTTNGAIASRVLPRDLTARAQVLSAERGATLFAVAFGALCATLARFTGQTEVVIGTQVSDRDQVELEQMIGQFVNSLILRNDLSGNPTFGEIVDRVRDTTAAALEHRHIPIERLLGMVKGARRHSNTPPISVNFIFQKTFIQNTKYGDFDLIDMPSLPAGAIYDLNFFMVERPDGWRLSCQYNTDQFNAATAERLLGYVQTLMEGAVADPRKRLSDLPLAPPNESRLLLVKLNDTRTLYPRELLLTKLFEVQVKRTPEAVAVACGGRELTYSLLNAAANRCAVHLQSKGITPGSKVAVCLPRGVEAPICILALLKIGAVYVPLDHGDPPARTVELLKSSGANGVISRGLAPGVTTLRGLNVIDIDSIPLSGAPIGDVSWGTADAATPAAIVFAGSGSTPADAVKLSHRTMSNLVYSMIKRPGINDRDVIVGTAAHATDHAQAELFLALLSGARLVLPLDKELATGGALLALLQKSGATMMFGSARSWSALIDAGWVGLPALKMLCLVQELSDTLRAKLASVGGELWAIYGRTATGIWSTFHLTKPDETAMLIGKPISNCSVVVIDQDRHLVSIGAVGKILLGGEGLLNGSVPDPLSPTGTNTLGETGDLARVLPNGEIEYLGAASYRITHRGRDIDPTEIERRVVADPVVAEAVVLHTGEESEECMIAAHIVLKEPAQDEEMRAQVAAALSRQLATVLPEYMVPGAIYVQNALPRDAEGTIDRTALFTPEPKSASLVTEPASPVESQIAAIWADALKLPSVQPTDNFFEIGGHSLVAARMLAQVERVLGKRVNLNALFNAPTLRAFAQALSRENLREFDFRQVVKIQPHGTQIPIVMINNTGIYYSLAKCLGSDQPVYSLQLFDPAVERAALPDTLEELARRYVELIKLVQPTGPYFLMGWCVAGALAYEIGCQMMAAGDQVAQLFLMDSWVPRYLARLPFLRGLINDYTLRVQFILDDFGMVLRGENSFMNFLRARNQFKFIANKAAQRMAGPGQTAVAESKASEAQDYDDWLLEFLKQLTNAYQPKHYSGNITLFRSRREPTGLWFDPLAGWGRFAEHIDLYMLDGNHFTMFQSPGVDQMASHIKVVMEACRKQR